MRRKADDAENIRGAAPRVAQVGTGERRKDHDQIAQRPDAEQRPDPPRRRAVRPERQRVDTRRNQRKDITAAPGAAAPGVCHALPRRRRRADDRAYTIHIARGRVRTDKINIIFILYLTAVG